MPDFSSAIQEYVRVVSSDAVTYPTGGSWLSALCIYNGVTQPVGGSWLIAWCNYLGITEPLDGAWVIALANYHGISYPDGGTWWMALALNASPPGVPFEWDLNTNQWQLEGRTWSLT